MQDVVSTLSGNVLWLGLITGLCIAGFEIMFQQALGTGQGLSLVYSAIGVLALFFTILIGLFFFKEALLWQHYVGILFAILAVALLSYQKPA